MKTIKNPLNPTKDQIKYRNRLWAEALISNKRKARGCMKDKSGGRCCLRVAEDLAIEMLPAEYTEGYERNDEFPGDIVADFFGWDKFDNDGIVPNLVVPGDDNCETESAAELNDNGIGGKNTRGLSHRKIAECVLNTFVHPKKPVWSFES